MTSTKKLLQYRVPGSTVWLRNGSGPHTLSTGIPATANARRTNACFVSSGTLLHDPQGNRVIAGLLFGHLHGKAFFVLGPVLSLMCEVENQ